MTAAIGQSDKGASSDLQRFIHGEKRQRTDSAASFLRVLPEGSYVARSPLLQNVAVASENGIGGFFRETLQPAQTVQLKRKLHPSLIALSGKIKEWMENQSLELRVVIEINMRIEAIITHLEWNQNRKKAELGLLYYYLTRDAAVPDAFSLLSKRVDEIIFYASGLEREHERICSPEFIDLIPCGSVAYLTRALARMIFTPDGAFNEGGCYAVKALMESPISLFATEEMRAQILSVVDLLLLDVVFRGKFMTPFSVHPSLHELIRIDQKLPVNEEIAFLYVRWDLLICLFTPIGQNEEGNCYAVAVASNLLCQHQDTLLNLLTEALQKGTFTFEGNEIPVLPLLESLRRYEKDFQTLVPGEIAVQLTGFTLAQQSLGVETEFNAEEKDLPLELVMASRFQEQAPYAKELFLSLKHNLLQQMLLGILQFTSLNTTIIRTKNPSGEYISWRRLLTVKLMKILVRKLIEQIQISERGRAYFTKKCSLWMKNLWLIDYRNWSPKVDSGRMVLDYHEQGLKLEGDLAAYQPLSKVRRLCYLKDGIFQPIDRISDLKDSLCRVADEASAMPEPSCAASEIDRFKGVVKSSAFTEDVAKCVQEMNGDEVLFSWECYLESDSLLLMQRGGDSGLIAKWQPIREHYASFEVIQSANVENFFLQVCQKIKSFKEKAPLFFTRQDPQILMITPNHSFNLNPLHFDHIWKDEPRKIMQLRLSIPSGILRSGRPSDAIKRRILSYTVDEQEAERVFSKISKGRIGIERFRREALALLPEYQECFDRAVNTVLTEIPFDSFKRRFLKSRSI